ncbi:MAG: hypothetical protein IPL46_32355 [Saprospiraceae bacterium]|nr:hypothetical protein [Saprospiraceae bacterium]
MPAQKYSQFSITLDLQEDAFGNVPGCYVSTQNGKKHNLYPSSTISKALTLKLDNFEILPDQKTQMLIDFDLRKLIRYGKDVSEIKYQFVADHDMKDAIRVVCKNKTGSIRGRFTNTTGKEQYIVAMIYRAGSFNVNRELNNSETEVPHFSSAVSSSKVNDNGEFYLPFLDKDSYHLIFAAFNRTGSRDFIGILDAKVRAGTNLENIHVEPGNELNIEGSYSAILPN